MSRLQLALDVDDLDASIAFYSALFDTEPAKVRPGYANFAVTDPPLKLVLVQCPGRGGSINHLGVEVADTLAVDTARARLARSGLASVDERDTVCCYARQDKFWVEGAPHGERWEIYTVLADSPTADGTPVETDWLPEACGLPAAEQPERARELDALFADDVVEVQRESSTRTRLDLRAEPEAAGRAATLAARETDCCSPLAFALTLQAGRASLVVTTDADHAAVLDTLTARAETARATA